MIDLSKTPDEVITIHDDDDAKVFLTYLGLFERLRESHQRPELSGKWASCIKGDTATHWIAAYFYSGFKNAAENGYVIHCLPKSRYTFQQFLANLAGKARKV